MSGMNVADHVGEAAQARGRFRGVSQRVHLRTGLVTVLYDPLEIYVGAQHVRLSPLEAALMELLVRQGRASALALARLYAQEHASVGSLDVHVHRIRRKFLEAGLFDPIETVRGWGLKLAMPAESASA